MQLPIVSHYGYFWAGASPGFRRGNIQQKITQQRLLKNVYENLYKIRTKFKIFSKIVLQILVKFKKIY